MCRKTLMVLLACLAGGVAAAPQRAAPQSIAIEDADTLLVDAAGVSYRIQLPDIDSPESADNPKLQRDMQRTGLDAETLLALGQAADEGLRGLLDASGPFTLVFDPDDRDRYGRVPGELYDVDGRALSLRLVEAGYAVPVVSADPGRAAELTAALAAARADGRGLWGSHAAACAAWAQPAGAVPAR